MESGLYPEMNQSNPVCVCRNKTATNHNEMNTEDQILVLTPDQILGCFFPTRLLVSSTSQETVQCPVGGGMKENNVGFC